MAKQDDDLDKLFEELLSDKIVEESPYGAPYGGHAANYKCPTVLEYWCFSSKKHNITVSYKNKDGRFHRLHGPAYIHEKYGIVCWLVDGKFHRLDGPAIVHKNNELWFKDGKLHRLDGPAVIDGAGPKRYFIDGQKLSPKNYKKEIERRKRKGLIK